MNWLRNVLVSHMNKTGSSGLNIQPQILVLTSSSELAPCASSFLSAAQSASHTVILAVELSPLFRRCHGAEEEKLTFIKMAFHAGRQAGSALDD